MAKAIGIGGVFMQFKGNTENVMDWYEEHLGFDMTDYGTGFTSGAQFLLLSFKRDSETAPFLNIRVDDVEELVANLKLLDIKFTMDVEEYPYGKFARFVDPFDNHIELWEVYEEEYIAMVQKEVLDYKKKKTK